MKRKIIFFVVFLSVLIIGFIWLIFSDLPGEIEVNNFVPESTVDNFYQFDWTEPLVASVRKVVPYNRISEQLKKAVIISEDDVFFYHSGLNMKELKNAFRENLEKKRYARGASTITMQLAKNAFLHKEKTLIRKLREILLTKKIETLYDKKKILEYYLNIVEWGPNVYGAEAAAQYYFGKSAAEINLAEGSLMAGILPNPKFYNPYKNMAGARRKQARVLRLMHNARLISSEEMNRILNQPVELRTSGKFPKLMQRLSIFDSVLSSPRLPDSIKFRADSLGIIFLPEGEDEF